MARWRHRRGRGAAVRRGRGGAPGLDGAPGALAVRAPVAAARGSAPQDAGRVRRALRRAGTRSPNWPGASPATASAPWPMPGGTMSGAGFYTAYAIAMLNTLVGNLNVEGGLVLDAGPFRLTARVRATTSPASPTAPRPRAWACRNRFPYESRANSSARRRRASRPIRPPRLVSGHRRTQLGNAGLGAGGLPVPRQVWFNHMSNPVYGIAGFRQALADKLRIRARCRWPSRSILHQRDQRAGRLHRAGHRDL